MRSPHVALPILLALCAMPGVLSSGVKYGDALPGVIYPSDIERMKRVLQLDRFSIIAAIRLGAAEGREAIVAEPLSDAALRRLKDGCDAGGFCPDPVGFVASRVRIVRLVGGDVDTIVTVEKEARGSRRRLVDLRALGAAGDIIGWNGRADASDGHIALGLTPIAQDGSGRIGAGLEPPLLIRFNPKTDRFQVYDCVAGDGDGMSCDFLDEPGD